MVCTCFSAATIIAKRNLSCSSAVSLYHSCLGFILDMTFMSPSSGPAQELPFLGPI